MLKKVFKLISSLSFTILSNRKFNLKQDENILVTSYERAGEFNGEETFSVTLESSGTITYTNA